MLNLYEHDMKIDIFILTEELRMKGLLENIGGPIYLSKLTEKDIIDPDFHVKIIMQKFFYRELIRISQEVQNESFEGLTDPIDIVDNIHSELLSLTDFDVE
jgi:replicative DNA helicase